MSDNVETLNTEIEVGNVVTLKSGGHLMTVGSITEEKIGAGTMKIALVFWMTEDQALISETAPLCVLKKATVR